MTSSMFDRTLAAARAIEPCPCARIYEDLKLPVLNYVRLRGAVDSDDVASEVLLRTIGGYRRSRLRSPLAPRPHSRPDSSSTR